MRILTVMNCSRADPSGMPVANASLSRWLRVQGATVDHLYVEDLPGLAGKRWARFTLFAALALRRIRAAEASSGPYDVIQFSGGDGYLAPYVRRDERRVRRLIVARSHGLEHRYWAAFEAEAARGHVRISIQHRLYFGHLRLWQVERSIRSADLLNCHTAADAAFVVERGWKDPSQIVILPGGVEPEWIGRDINAAGDHGRRLLFSGSWTWMKGTRVLVATFQRLATADPQLSLTVIGSGVSADRVLADFPPDLRHRVTVHPALTHSEVLAQMRRHDLLLSTSLFEGFGTVVFEAMAAGLPVVASAVGGAVELIENGRTGFLVPAGDVPRFVESCRSVLAMDPLEEGRVRAAASEFAASFAWPTVAAATLTAYRDALVLLRGS